jgi:ankyrin repeat protein
VYDVARTGCAADMLSIIKEYPEVINYNNSNGFSPLTLACYNGNIDVVSVLVKHVKNINVPSDSGTPLMAATFKGNVEISKLLLDNKADVNATDISDNTALHYAIRFTNEAIIKLLVSYNADINLKDKRGFSALDYAIQDKNENILKILKKEKL